MSAIIYTMYQGADPALGWKMNDPIFGKRPTLGACVPNIRRNVKVGDWLFVISGRVRNERQYIVGGFKVAEKISQLAALARFPELAVTRDEQGHVLGNVIVNADGTQREADSHTNFERRLENYIVGTSPVVLETAEEVRRARAETLPILTDIFGKEGNRPFDIIGRARKLDDAQVDKMLKWLRDVKG